jgi:hypothetical protein
MTTASVRRAHEITLEPRTRQIPALSVPDLAIILPAIGKFSATPFARNFRDDADLGLIGGLMDWNPLCGKVLMENAPRKMRGVELEDRYRRGF